MFQKKNVTETTLELKDLCDKKYAKVTWKGLENHLNRLVSNDSKYRHGCDQSGSGRKKDAQEKVVTNSRIQQLGNKNTFIEGDIGETLTEGNRWLLLSETKERKGFQKYGWKLALNGADTASRTGFKKWHFLFHGNEASDNINKDCFEGELGQIL